MHRFLVIFICFYCARAALISDSSQNGQYRAARSTNVDTCDPLPLTMTSPKTGQKAWDKCIEYQEKLIYPCEKSAALSEKGSRGNKCGHSADDLILRNEAYPNEFPHMALLGAGEHPKISWNCNGALISDRFILAAGHCSYNREVGSLNIAALGVLKVEDIQETNLYKLSEIVRHPDFKPPSKYNDIALFKTEKPVKLDQTVIPACLHVGDQINDRKGLYTGWNLRELHDKSSTSAIRMIFFDKYSDDECKAAYSQPLRNFKKGVDSTTQVCYGDKSNSTTETCRTDGGGPIQVRSEKIMCMYVIVGVASFGKNCGDPKYPDIYTRVSGFVPWIESVVWPDTE